MEERAAWREGDKRRRPNDTLHTRHNHGFTDLSACHASDMIARTLLTLLRTLSPYFFAMRAMSRMKKKIPALDVLSLFCL